MKISFRLFAVFLVLVLIPFTINAEIIEITGSVIDDDSISVEGAMVSLVNTKLSTTTNDSGRFVIRNIVTSSNSKPRTVVHQDPTLHKGEAKAILQLFWGHKYKIGVQVLKLKSNGFLKIKI